MNEIKEYFVPVEFTEKASIGIELAILLAQKTGSGIHMVHSIGNDKRYLDRKFLNSKVSYTTKILEKLIHYYSKKTNDSLKINFSIVRDEVNTAIVFNANNTDDSAISLGIQNNQGIFTRNLPNKVLSTSIRPIFAACSNVLPPSINNIVLPLDITPETKIKVPFTAFVAKMFNAQIHVLTLSTSGEDKKALHLYSQQVIDYFKNEGVVTKSVNMNGNNLVDMILYYTEKVCGDMISVMAQQDKGFYNYFSANYTSQLLFRSPVPLMLIPRQSIFFEKSEVKEKEKVNQ